MQIESTARRCRRSSWWSTPRTPAYQDIQTKLYTLKTAADDLRRFTLFDGSPRHLELGHDPPHRRRDEQRLAGHLRRQRHAHGRGERQAAAGAVVHQLVRRPTPATAPTRARDQAHGADRRQRELAGCEKGQAITLQSTKNGDGAQTPATFTVTDTTTLEDLRSFVQTNLSGWTVTLGQGGKMQITSPPGDEQAFTGVSLGPGGTALGGAGGVGTTNPPAPTGRSARCWCTAAATSTSARRGSRSTSR